MRVFGDICILYAYFVTHFAYQKKKKEREICHILINIWELLNHMGNHVCYKYVLGIIQLLPGGVRCSRKICQNHWISIPWHNFGIISEALDISNWKSMQPFASTFEKSPKLIYLSTSSKKRFWISSGLFCSFCLLFLIFDYLLFIFTQK